MKKAVVILVLTMFGFTLQSMAQMTLKVPKWEKFVKITAENVNLRKAPDANSPRLMSQEQGFGWRDFSWTPKADFEAFHLEVGTILPVLKETGDWYCLYLNNVSFGHLQGVYEVYVMKKFCTTVTPIAINVNAGSLDEEIEKVKGNKGYLIGVYFLGSYRNEPWCRIGHQVSKYVVMADYDGFKGGMDFVRKFCAENDGVVEFQSSRVTDAHVDKFIKSQKVPSVFDILIQFPGSRFINQFTIDSSTYKYPMTTHNF